MTPAPQSLLLCALLLCGLGGTVLSQRGRCSGGLCVALFPQPDTYEGARRRCQASGGELYQYNPDWHDQIPAMGNGTHWVDARIANPGICYSFSEGRRGEPVQREPCALQRDGYLCQYALQDPCVRLQAGAGARVRYAAYQGFQVEEVEEGSDAFPQATIAFVQEEEEEKDGYPESKHLCFLAGWLRAPWRCEVLGGGCAHGCVQVSEETSGCTCPPGARHHRNGLDCVDVDACADGKPCKCEEGFEWVDGVCEDFSNCSGCEHVLCEKVGGARRCACRPGFAVSPVDPDKCVEDCKERDCPLRCDPANKDQCFCPDGYIENEGVCSIIPVEEEEEEKDEGSGSSATGSAPTRSAPTSRTPSPPTPVRVHPSSVPSYVKTGSVLGIAVFLLLCAALLYLLVHNALKRCGRFELSPLKRPDIDIFYLQQVTTETYKRLSLDKQHRSDQTPLS